MKYIFSLVILFVLSFPLLSEANTPVVMVTGDIANTSFWDSGWTHLVNVGGYPSEINVRYAADFTKARFSISLPVGKTSLINFVVDGTQHNWVACQLSVSVIDQTHAVITQIGGADAGSPVTCNYSGDPDNNTAVISLTHNFSKVKL